MIEIKLDDTRSVIDKCKKYSIDYSAGIKNYSAYESGKIIGFCIFTINHEKPKESAEILRIQIFEGIPLSIADGLLRSALYYMLEHGVKTAKCAKIIDESFLTLLHFIKAGDTYSVEIKKEIFDCGCNEKE